MTILQGLDDQFMTEMHYYILIIQFVRAKMLPRCAFNYEIAGVKLGYS